MNELILAGLMAVAPGYPSAHHGLRDQGQVTQWQRQAEQRSLQAIGKKLGDAMLEEFDMKGLDDPRQWTPATALVGGAYVAAAGLKLDVPVGAWKLGVRALPIHQTGKLFLSRRF